MVTRKNVLVGDGLGKVKYFTAAWIGVCVGASSSAFYMALLGKENVSAVHQECVQKAEKVRYEASDYLNKYNECSTKYSECERGER